MDFYARRRHQNIRSQPVRFVILRLPHAGAIFDQGRILTRYRQLSNNIAPTNRANSATVFAGGLPVRNPKALFDRWSGFRGHALGEDKLQSARITFRIHTSMARIADRRVRKI